MILSPSDVTIKACEAAFKFSSGEYGRNQAYEIAKTLTEDKSAARAIGALLQIIHDDGRKLAARSCPFAAGRG
ncbi:hypothetical protein [Bilophila wadsworthia]